MRADDRLRRAAATLLEEGEPLRLFVRSQRQRLEERQLIADLRPFLFPRRGGWLGRGLRFGMCFRLSLPSFGQDLVQIGIF